MSETNARCAAKREGIACREPITSMVPVPLCTDHRMEIAAAILPQLMTAAMATRSYTSTIACAEKAEPNFKERHSPQVYFLRNGNRVKIGTTTNLGARISGLSQLRENVVLVLHGGPELETALHRYFADYRKGNSEWFEYTNELHSFILLKHTDSEPEEEAAETTNLQPDDALMHKAATLVTSAGYGSASLLQRRLRIGFARASRLLDMLEERGIVGPQQGAARARRVINPIHGSGTA